MYISTDNFKAHHFSGWKKVFTIKNCKYNGNIINMMHDQTQWDLISFQRYALNMYMYGSTIQLQEWDKNVEARSIVTLLFRLIWCSLGKGNCWGRIWGLLPPQASPPALSKASSFGEGTLSPSSP